MGSLPGVVGIAAPDPPIGCGKRDMWVVSPRVDQIAGDQTTVEPWTLGKTIAKW